MSVSFLSFGALGNLDQTKTAHLCHVTGQEIKSHRIRQLPALQVNLPQCKKRLPLAGMISHNHLN